MDIFSKELPLVPIQELITYVNAHIDRIKLRVNERILAELAHVMADTAAFQASVMPIVVDILEDTPTTTKEGCPYIRLPDDSPPRAMGKQTHKNGGDDEIIVKEVQKREKKLYSSPEKRQRPRW